MIVQKHHEVIMIEWPAFNDDGALDNFRGDSASFRFNQKKHFQQEMVAQKMLK